MTRDFTIGLTYKTSMSTLHQAQFLVTINHLVDLPTWDIPEVAFAGRSNAGKSTAINVLCQQNKIGRAHV